MVNICIQFFVSVTGDLFTIISLVARDVLDIGSRRYDKYEHDDIHSIDTR